MPSEYRGGRDTDPPLRRPGSKPVEDRPAEGLRVERPFADDLFGDYHARRKESGSSFGLIAGLVIGVAAVGGIGWYMWSTGALELNPQSGPPQLVEANPDPYKVKPKDPGGMHVENQDKLVYDRVARGEALPRVENLLPLPEEPKAPPRAPEPAVQAPEAAEPPKIETAKAEPATAAPAPSLEKPAPRASEKPTAESPAAKAGAPEATPAETAKTAAKPSAAKPAEEAKPSVQAAKPANEPAAPEQDPLAAAVLAATGGREAATGPIVAKPAAQPATAPQGASQVAAAPPLAAAPVGPASSVAPRAAAPVPGAIQIQLASARSEEGAMGEWNRIFAKNKAILEGLAPNVARVDLGEKGVFFRLRAGPVADRGAADRLCAALSAQNVGCIVVRP